MTSQDAPAPPPGDEPLAETERADPRFRDLETLPRAALLEALIGGQEGALRAVREALPAIGAAVGAAAPLLAPEAAGRLAYAGAGTSGRLAALDGVELTPTFGWPPERTLLLVAGGVGSLASAREGAEDEREAARLAVEAHGLGRGDVLVALAASGRTPFTLAAAEAARAGGALTVGLANDPDAPLLAICEHPILLRTGPEVLAGSTRMAAGTAQKIALTLLSTALMVENGKVFRGRMVDMRATNDKLRRRAERIVREVTGADAGRARDALERERWDVRAAILRIEGAGSAS